MRPLLDAAKSRYSNSDAGGGVPLPSGGTSLNISPCQTMKDMASNASTFYSDANSEGNGCYSPNTPSSLNSIFRSIAYTLTVARLIPNSAWPQT